MHPEFAPVALIAAFSLFLALPWHWRAGNVATLSIIGWLFVTNIIYAVDAIIWANNVDMVALPWCDISAFVRPLPPQT
jgi:pheromone a factor receptor